MPNQTIDIAVFAPVRHIAIEYFDSGALLLNLRSRKLIELDARQSWILSRVDGQHTVGQIVESCAEYFALAYEEAVELVQATCEKLLEEQALRLVHGIWKGGVVDNKRYIQNPDVNLREEDEDGALLYNPDTDRVQLLNSTGLYIWKLCAAKRTVSEITTAFQADFDEVPEGEVVADVEEFVDAMVDSGFIGVLEPQ